MERHQIQYKYSIYLMDRGHLTISAFTEETEPVANIDDLFLSWIENEAAAYIEAEELDPKNLSLQIFKQESLITERGDINYAKFLNRVAANPSEISREEENDN